MQFYLRAIRYFRHDLSKIVLSLLLIGAMTLLGLLQPFPLAILIDLFVGAQGKEPGIMHRAFLALSPDGSRVSQILTLAVVTLALSLAQQVLQMYQKLLDIRIGYNGLMRVRCDLFQKLQELSIGYHRSQPQGDAIYRLSWDTFGFQGILNFATGTLTNAATLVGMAALMFVMNWRLTLASLAVLPLLFWVIKRYARLLSQRSSEAKEVDAQLTTAIQRSMATVGIVQAFGREQDEYARFHQTVQSSVAANMRMHWKEVLFWLELGVIFAVGTALLIGYGGYLVHVGALTIGSLTIFLQYQAKLYDPLNKLSASGGTLASALAGAKRVFEVLDRDAIIKDAPNAIAFPRKPRELRFDHVSFAYRAGETVLDDIDVSIAPGQMVAFVGSSGVGKTTLLNLLPRFYDPTAGAIKLDDQDIRGVKTADLRKHVALVLQDNVILPTTVSENIAYGRPDATEQQIRHAAELAGAAAFVEKLPQKYETLMSESGTSLSGGQKQRIGIARALITEAPIIVLDEPTSALDPQHEQMITQTLKGLRGSRTIVLVSHRLSTVADCDQIFVMDSGKIVERGTHDELIAKRGLYFEMAKHQMRLEEAPLVPSPSGRGLG